MANNVNNLKIQLDERRRQFDFLNHSYDQIRSRALSLFVAQFAFGGFVFTQLENIRKDTYGITFLVFGALLLLLSLGYNIKNYLSATWFLPMGELEIEKMNNSDSIADAYKVILDDYADCINKNTNVYVPSANRWDYTIYLYAASVIILISLMLG